MSNWLVALLIAILASGGPADASAHWGTCVGEIGLQTPQHRNAGEILVLRGTTTMRCDRGAVAPWDTDLTLAISGTHRYLGSVHSDGVFEFAYAGHLPGMDDVRISPSPGEGREPSSGVTAGAPTFSQVRWGDGGWFECPSAGDPVQSALSSICATRWHPLAILAPSPGTISVVMEETVDGETAVGALDVTFTEPAAGPAPAEGSLDGDLLISAKPDGAYRALAFPAGTSLWLNSPGLEHHVPALPTGVLVSPIRPDDLDIPAFDGSGRAAPEGASPSRSVAFKKENMRRVPGKSRCYELNASPSGQSSESYARISSCFHRFRPATNDDDDGSQTWNTRAIASEGSTRGGDSAHRLLQARHKVRLSSNPVSQKLVSWAPGGTRYPDPGQEVTTRLGIGTPGGGGAYGEVSLTHVLYPSTFGPDPHSPNLTEEFHRAQWAGTKRCCDVVEMAGGIQFDYKADDGFRYETGAKIWWECGSFGVDTCERQAPPV